MNERHAPMGCVSTATRPVTHRAAWRRCGPKGREVISLTPLVELLRNVLPPQLAAPTPIDLTSTPDPPDDSAHSE
jgi:hypothetical protein